MKFKSLLIIVFTTLFILSCIKHEIIPAPTPTVELKSKFTGTINGVPKELVEGVSGYTCIPTQEKNLVNSPELSSVIFYSQITSSTATPAIKIGIGKLYWDTGVSSDPTVGDFNSFFTATSNILPPYKNDCSSGFNVEYIDENGTKYSSNENSVNFKDAKFTNITQESDASGDYSKFLCTFNCYVYYSSGPSPAPGLDSVRIQNGQLKGWFKK
jgi:hypothetical protein